MVAFTIGVSKQPIEGVGDILKKIISSKKANDDTLISVAFAIGGSKQPIEGAGDILKKIISSEKANRFILDSVKMVVGNVKQLPAHEKKKLLEMIEMKKKSQ